MVTISVAQAATDTAQAMARAVPGTFAGPGPGIRSGGGT